MKLKNIRYMKKVKGSVLFTVIVVMFVMLIMVTATLSLAANASNRAYSSYMKNQATYTARSAVEATIAKLNTDPNGDMSKDIMSLLDSTGSATLTVSDVGGGYGTIDKIVITDTGKLDSETGFYIAGSKQRIFKITAHTTIGGKKKTFSQYVTSKTDDGGGGGGTGLVALAENSGFSSTGATVLGFSGTNIDKLGTSEEILKNDGLLLGEKVYNSSIKINTATIFKLIEDEGVYVNGSLSIDNVSFRLLSNYPSIDNKDLKRPYLYVENEISTKNQLFLGMDANKIDKTWSYPINIFAGSIKFTDDQSRGINANIYLHDSTKTSEIGGKTGSGLIEWYEKNATGTLTDGSSNKINSLYSKGNVIINGGINSGEEFTIYGDMYVAGNLTVNGRLKVTGNLNVVGNINGESNIFDIKGDKKSETPTLNFPPEMEKDKITGEDGIIRTGTTTRPDYYHTDIEGNETVKGSKQKVDFPFIITNAKKIYNAGDLSGGYNTDPKKSITTVITEDCIIKGTQNNINLKFVPASNNQATIKVLLFDASFDTGQIIVDDSDNSKVEFYIATSDNVFKEGVPTKNGVTFSNVKILTEYYEKKIAAGEVIDGFPYLTGGEGEKAIPGIYIYGPSDTNTHDPNPPFDPSKDPNNPGYKIDQIKDDGHKIAFISNCVFTGTINAPQANYYQAMGLSDTVLPYNYKNNIIGKADIGNKQLALVTPSAVVKNIMQFQNDCIVYIVHPNGRSNGDGDKLYKWTTVDGFADY